MKVVFDLAAQQITIDGDGPELISVLQSAREIAPLISQIQITTTKPDPSRQPPLGNGGGNGGSSDHPTTMKQFVRGLALKNVSERIAAIAYYVKTRDKQDVFSPKDMDGWFTNCGIGKPAQMPVAISDAKRKYRYLESSGHGKWKLTADGENIVVQRMNESERNDE